MLLPQSLADVAASRSSRVYSHPLQSIKQRLSLLGHTLSSVLLLLLQLRNASFLALLQLSRIDWSYRRRRIREASVSSCSDWREIYDVKAANARRWDDVVIAGLGSTIGGSCSRVERHYVEDWICCE